MQVQKFKYFGRTLTDDKNSDTEIQKCIGITNDSFEKSGRVLSNRKCSSGIKKRDPKRYAIPVLHYGSEY